MPERRMDLLDKDFAATVQKALAACKARGVIMEPYFTLRSPHEQAKLYRQSRKRDEIENAIMFLKGNGAHYLASVLNDVGPQKSGPWATNALPAMSWHQWGEAVDCMWMRNGKVDWTVDKTPTNGYKIFADECIKLGLESGFYWKSQDSGHVQKRKDEIPNLLKKGVWTYEEIDRKMYEMYHI